MVGSEGEKHTLQSHGLKLLRLHMYDWTILLILVVTDVVLNVIEPFHRFVGEDMIAGLTYPLKGNTIPFWAVAILAIIGPAIVFSGFYIARRDVYDVHHATLGLLFSLLITAVLTDAIKDAVGRPRPDFFWRCFPDGVEAFDPATKGVICHGVKSEVKEGYKSFPSGHTSWSFAGLGFLSWYLSGKLNLYDRKGHVAKLCLMLLPLVAATLVGISRVDDYWHFWEDILAGALLGWVVATLCYLQFFPFPHDARGWAPYAYFEAFGEERRIVQLSSRTASSHLHYGPQAELKAGPQNSKENPETALLATTIAVETMGNNPAH